MYATLSIYYKSLELLIKFIKRNLFDGHDMKSFVNDFNKLGAL